MHNHLLADFPRFRNWARTVGYKPNAMQMAVHRRILDRTRIKTTDRAAGKTTAIAAEVAFAATEFCQLPPHPQTLVICATYERCADMAASIEGFLDRSKVQYEVLARHEIHIQNGGLIHIKPLGELTSGFIRGIPRQKFICFDEIGQYTHALRAILPLAPERFLSLSS